MTMSSRKPATGALGFFAWFSTRTWAMSGHAGLTSDSRTAPSSIPVSSRTRVELPSSTKSGTQPPANRTPTTIKGVSLMTLLRDASEVQLFISSILMALSLDDSRRDEQQQLVVRVGDEPVAEQVAEDGEPAQERRR